MKRIQILACFSMMSCFSMYAQQQDTTAQQVAVYQMMSMAAAPQVVQPAGKKPIAPNKNSSQPEQPLEDDKEEKENK